LAPFHDGPRAHFVSNIDGAHIADVLKPLDPATTLVIIASKTFTTVETMTNAETARRWIEAALGADAVGAHFVAVSTALDKVAAFGIAPDRVFGFWDWVGGRYSLWSAIGLPIMLAIGPERFRSFLDGAHAMDEHFRTAPLLGNLPVVLGLVGFWHRVAKGYPARAVIPYDQRLARLPAYLQQLDMESNGKSVAIDGQPVSGPTGPLVWGEPGTNGQHAFFQLLHQGSDVIPVEFIAAAVGHEPDLRHQHELLLANCLAQSQALMTGRTLEEARAQMLSKGMAADEVERIAPHRVFPGNRPSITILHRQLDPFALGRLIALYEHRVFVEAQLFGINAFDQWGVELGKELATALLPVVEGKRDAAGSDASTAGLVAYLRGFA
ncbi:MAG: glucose-6-phosphate isomerase, partial [Mesorhizobium sp.]